YYARYKIDNPDLANNQKYITESLKTGEFDTACERARNQYAMIQVRLEAGIPVKDISVNRAIDQFLNNYEKNFDSGVDGFSIHMLRGYRKSVDIYWRDYIGDRLLNTITVVDLEGYEIWRRNWSKTTKRKKLHGNYKENVSRRTLEWEINGFKTVLRWCSARNHYNGKAFDWKFARGERRRRSAFTLDQYKKLHAFLASDDYFPFGRYDNNLRTEYHRMMLRTYIHFMINTGLRPGESRYLKWGDVSRRKNLAGQTVPVIRVSSTHSKVNKLRNVVGRPAALMWLDDWKDFRAETGEFCGDDTYIFCTSKGVPIKDFREGFNNIIRNAGVEFDADGEKLVIYSLRHTYITFRLQYGRNVSIYTIAKNCGTSVAMIEQFYSDAVSEDYIEELSI
ncbi:MAG: tyrosine-type recombinase/integrase, partial [Rhodospirillales bacterium]|nr:tyrosine-type recombinase/integrase [Rhodospirillales bacterium]